VSGDIFFLQHNWSGSGASVEFVMEFLASRVRDPSVSEELSDMIRDNVVLLDLSDPASSELVDLIIDELPNHIATLEDTRLRDHLTKIFANLLCYAREQRSYNRDPSQDTCFTMGPYPARYFRLDNLMSSALRQLTKTDFVRIDVSDYTAEQRALVRDYVDKLGNPRVLVVGDDRPTTQ